MKRRAALLALAAASLSAQEKLWWRSLTPDQAQPVSCALAKDEQALVRIVSPLGWDKQSFPSFDWANRYVVVIAPNTFHRGYHLGFLEQRKQDKVLEFRWGWVTPSTSSSGAKSMGGGQEGKEAIVVAFFRDDLNGRTLSCPEAQ